MEGSEEIPNPHNKGGEENPRTSRVEGSEENPRTSQQGGEENPRTSRVEGNEENLQTIQQGGRRKPENLADGEGRPTQELAGGFHTRAVAV